MATKLQSIPLTTITGEQSSLAAFDGKVLLVVNVASKCGLTPQYEQLESIHTRYKEQGFSVLGFPANDFGQQEPGSHEEIQTFCRSNYGVDFPVFGKISVKGAGQHPLYAELIAAQPRATEQGGDLRKKLAGYGFTQEQETDVLWNFEKFLIGRNGEVVARFAPDIRPDDAAIVEAIERELAKTV